MELKKTLAILLPSRVTSRTRYSFASESYKSIICRLKNNDYTFIAVHDHPSLKKLLPKFFHSLFPQIVWSNKVEQLYIKGGVICISGRNQGSAAALLDAARFAFQAGNTFGFIHLDDHVYCHEFDRILADALDSLKNDEKMKWIRFSGYPIIYNNKVDICISKSGAIEFDRVRLSPLRNENFTVWFSPLVKEVNLGNYWPIAFWFCIYRLDFLIVILEYAISRGAVHLADAEIIFKSGDGFEWIIKQFPGGLFGYINMQFGGIEMHQNKNWKELIDIPNVKIL